MARVDFPHESFSMDTGRLSNRKESVMAVVVIVRVLLVASLLVIYFKLAGILCKREGEAP
ncbi:hypothetical protein CCACVL1_24288 [Corchorus capsularis]|uniref:Uncharacterized protein n=1 Tax=Corchorus capsularis TaxID=210143 RepID=A0A1R3GQC3_COCAP|nr:hypothetical protein CCACVL1_24288 [Corchorus capsularis]